VVLVLEISGPFITSTLAVDDARMQPDQWLGLEICVLFSALRGWTSSPYNAHSTNVQRFSSETLGGRGPEGN